MAPGASADGVSTTPNPIATVRLAIANGGGAYAGDCESTTPSDVGQYCSKFSAEHYPVRAYLIGPTFSEFTAWLFIQQIGENEFISLGFTPYDESNIIPWPNTN